jgi:homoserine acetyltransferase
MASNDTHTASVGIVRPQIARFTDPLKLRGGSVLREYELVYETYGRLNAGRSNAVEHQPRHRQALGRRFPGSNR